MSASMYIVVQGDDPGFDIFVNGRALARNEDALEKLAEKLGAKTLPPPQWFTPEDGLITICTLLDFLRSSATALGNETSFVVGELDEFERVLRKTAARRLRWQLAVSWK